jgi:hypothetical protein
VRQNKKFIHFSYCLHSAFAEFFPTIIFINCNHKLSFNDEKREFFLMTSSGDAMECRLAYEKRENISESYVLLIFS